MLISEIADLLHARTVFIGNEALTETDFTSAFATDLMSDALAMIQSSPESTLLLTGLCNPQVLRTAEMLDLHTIVFVRGKDPFSGCLELAGEMDMNIYSTDLTMYKACGLLYCAGLEGIDR